MVVTSTGLFTTIIIMLYGHQTVRDKLCSYVVRFTGLENHLILLLCDIEFL